MRISRFELADFVQISLCIITRIPAQIFLHLKGGLSQKFKTFAIAVPSIASGLRQVPPRHWRSPHKLGASAGFLAPNTHVARYVWKKTGRGHLWTQT